MRRMYSDAIAQQRRYASFIGTSNRQEVLRETNGAFETQTPLEMLLQDTFFPATEDTDGAELLRITEILEAVSHHRAFNRKQMNSLVHLGRALMKLGFQSKRKTPTPIIGRRGCKMTCKTSKEKMILWKNLQ